MNRERIEFLLQLHANGQGSEAETRELLTVLREHGADEILEPFMQNLFNEAKNAPSLPADWKRVWDNILKGTRAPVRKMIWRAAAVIIILFSIGGYFYFNKSAKQIAKAEQLYKNDIPPGRNRAILTLSDNQQIILDSAANGTLTQQGNIKIIKLDSGQLAYTGSSPEGEAGVGYNTITTPKGGQYQIILADGSKVWLNAASCLRFPASFSKDRRVELTGEGYFEVIHNAASPFTVSVNGISVEDLGTHFNINAYNDEAVIKTTLLEGSVKVSVINHPSTILKPGQQSIASNGQLTTINADLDEAVAWKNGRFIFQGNNIQSVMRQLARWYDVDIKYEGVITDEEFVGVINRSRYENISSLLQMLEKTRTVSFAISGKNITVMPFKK